MATATLSNTPTIINNAESTSSWGGDSFILDPDTKVAGNNSVSCVQTTRGANDVYVTGSWDFSTDVHLRLWMNSTIISVYGHTKANDGLQVFLSDGSNTAYWTVGGSDTYFGGWTQLVVYTGNPPTSGTVTKSSITRIGIRINTVLKPRNTVNAWFDQWTYGDGYTVTGGTSGDEIDWSHIASLDKASAYGVVTEIDGVYFISGDVKIGNGAVVTHFKDNGQMCMFRDVNVAPSLYNISYSGSGTVVTITGGSYGAAGLQTFTFDANDPDVSFTMSGKQISRISSGIFYSGQTIKNCVFDACGPLTISSSTFQNNTISNTVSTTGALVFPADESNFSSCKFLDNTTGPAIYHSVAETVSYNAHTFSGNTYDINNNSTGLLTVNASNGSNPSTYTNTNGGTTSIVNSKVLTLYNIQAQSEVRIYRASDSVYLGGIEAVVSDDGTGKGTYKFEYAYNYVSDIPIYIQVLSLTHENIKIDYVLGALDSSIPVQQRYDRNYTNP